MKADELGRVSVAFPENIRKALKVVKDTIGPSYTKYINIAVAEKLKRDGFIRRGK